jgi:hypothetical protein
MRSYLLVAGLALLTVPVCAQNTAAKPNYDRGFISITTLQSSFDSDSHVLKWDSNVGYQFNRHFAMESGIPVYFAGSTLTTTTTTGTTKTSSTSNGVGDIYLNLRLMATSPKLNFASTVIGTAPTGDRSKGLTSGHATVTWLNHFERSFSKLTPFGEVSVGNTIRDSRFFARPFTSYGTVVAINGGGSYDLSHGFSMGVSAYALEPTGTQTIESKVQHSSTASAGSAATSGKKPVFLQNNVTVGTGDLDRDHGFTTWLGFDPTPYWAIEGGYNRSTQFDLNTFTFNVGLNIGKLWRDKQKLSH